jgi:hypothetical protein
VFAFYLAFAFFFVVCLGGYGTAIFFTATLALFAVYLAFFDYSSASSAFEL